MADEKGAKPAKKAEQETAKPEQYGKLRLSEKVIGVLGLVVLLGWMLHLFEDEPAAAQGGFPWFATGSITGAVLVLALLALKLNCLEVLGRDLQEKLLPAVCLLPVLGFLIEEMSSLHSLLTVGGALALAYISATSYWRHSIPDFVKNPLGSGEGAAKEEESEAKAAEASAASEDDTVPSQESAPAAPASADAAPEAAEPDDGGHPPS